MKKNHSPGGARIGMRMLLYTTVFLAVIGTRESLSGGTGPLSKTLGKAFNTTLMAASKIGLGIALITHDKEDPTSVTAQGSMMLGRASHRGYVNAAKVKIYSN